MKLSDLRMKDIEMFIEKVFKWTPGSYNIQLKNNSFLLTYTNKFWGTKPKYVLTENSCQAYGDYKITEMYQKELEEKWLEFLSSFEDEK